MQLDRWTQTSSLRWPPRGDMQELPLQVDWEFAQYVFAAFLGR